MGLIYYFTLRDAIWLSFKWAILSFTLCYGNVAWFSTMPVLFIIIYADATLTLPHWHSPICCPSLMDNFFLCFLRPIDHVRQYLQYSIVQKSGQGRHSFSSHAAKAEGPRWTDNQERFWRLRCIPSGRLVSPNSVCCQHILLLLLIIS
jgi:hypothetical protein